MQSLASLGPQRAAPAAAEPPRLRSSPQGAARERGSAAADRGHGIFTRVLKIQFPAMMSRINAAAARKFSSMR
jgi:hypothetical protein